MRLNRLYILMIPAFLILVGVVWYVRHGGSQEGISKTTALRTLSPAEITLTEPFVSLVTVKERGSDLVKPNSFIKEDDKPVRTKTVANSVLQAAVQAQEDALPSEAVSMLDLSVIRKWAETDPRAAGERVKQLPVGAERKEALSAIAIIWANNDLKAAIEWASQLPEGNERESILQNVAYEAARSDPAEALRLAFEQTEQPEWDELIKYSLMQWASKDPEGASEWAEKMTDGPLKERMLAGITTVWGDADPALAANVALQSMAPGRQQDDAVVGIVQRWVQKEPKLTAEWVLQFPDGDLKLTVLENVVKLWADKDTQQFGDWLNSLPEGTTRDKAVGVFVGWLAPAHPAEAVQWAESISNAQERHQQIELVSLAGR